MRITIERELEIGELLSEIQNQYGSRAELEAHLEEHPDDWNAKVALHDLREYEDTDPTKQMTDTREIVLPEEALDEITFRRLELVLQINRAGGDVDGIRELARLADRDKKNVSEDVQALRELGLVSVQPRGPGKPHQLKLPGHRIELHLLEAGR